MTTEKIMIERWKRRKVTIKTTWGKVISSWIRSMSFTAPQNRGKFRGNTMGFINITTKTGKRYRYRGSFADYSYMRNAKGGIYINGAGSHGWRINFFDRGEHKLQDKKWRKK